MKEYRTYFDDFSDALNKLSEIIKNSLVPMAEKLKFTISDVEEQQKTQKEKDRKANKAVINKRKKTVYKLNSGYKNNNIRTSSYYSMLRKRK